MLKSTILLLVLVALIASLMVVDAVKVSVSGVINDEMSLRQ
jgi:hypothetical protein